MVNGRNNQVNVETNPRQMNGRVILIINGLNKQGRTLAGKLSQQGADVVIAGSGAGSEWIPRIRQVVTNNGRSCLFLIPACFSTTQEKPFSYHAIQKIIKKFRRLDAFITYADTDNNQSNQASTTQDDAPPAINFFDQYRLSQAAMKQILTQKNARKQTLDS